MKRILLLMLLIAAGYIVPAQAEQTASADAKQSRREQKRREKEAKAAEFTMFMDSLVRGHNYVFIPNTYQIQPAGRNKQVRSVNFRLEVTDDRIYVNLPFPGTFMPPYRIGTLEYTLTDVPDYTASKAAEGNQWVMTFRSDMFGSTTYHFKLIVDTSNGNATLDVTTSRSQIVSYYGHLSQLY